MNEIKRFDASKLNGLLNRAEEYKEQLNIVNATYKDMLEHKDGKAILYIYTNGAKTNVALDEETIVMILTSLHKRYKELICETKLEIDKLYEPFIGDKV